MAIPFAAKWQVSSLRWTHGSFVEVAQVKPVQTMAVGDFWVERPVVDLKPAHVERLRRRTTARGGKHCRCRNGG